MAPPKNKAAGAAPDHVTRRSTGSPKKPAKASLMFSKEIVALARDADAGKTVDTTGWDIDTHLAFAASRQK